MDSENGGISVKADLEPVMKAAPVGLRYIFNLLFGERHAEAERMLKLSNAQDAVDVKRIIAGEAYFDQSSQRLVEVDKQNYKRLIVDGNQEDGISNLIGCSMHAAEYIQEGDRGDGAIELQDFINRWKNEAKLISSESAQAIWGRVLAQEVNSPGSISLRTIDVIKNLSQKEALSFNEVCKYVFFDKLVVDNKSDFPIAKEVFSSLRDAGLIATFTPGMYTSTPWPKTKLSVSGEEAQDVVFVRNNDLFVFIGENDLISSKYDVPKFNYWELTTAGRELYKVVCKNLSADIADAIKVFSRDLMSKAKFTRYTNIDKHEVDSASIVNVNPG